jgi:hypothetical protein
MLTSPIMPMLPGQRFPGRAMAAPVPNTASLSHRSYSGAAGNAPANEKLVFTNELGQARRPKSSQRSLTADRRVSVALTGEGKRSSSAPVRPSG